MIIVNESEAQTREIASRLPKVQLHLHLDGSLPESFITKRAKSRHRQLPCEPSFLRHYLLSQKQAALSTDRYTQAPGSNWDVFTFCNSFLQTASELYDAVQQIVNRLTTEHNCHIIELRFCPHLHTIEGLSPDQVVESVTSSFRSTGVIGGIILVALRSFPTTHVDDILNLATKWQSHGVIAIDIAGDEGTYPLSIHSPQLQKCSPSFPLTLHAGEWGDNAVENIRIAVHDIGAKRLGHALALRHDIGLQKDVKNLHIPIELCLTANCNGGKKIPADQFHLHPLKEWVKNNLPIAGFNCDNLLLSGTFSNQPCPTEEIVRARRYCGLTWNEIAKVLIDGARATFAKFESETKRNEFLKQFEDDVRTAIGNLR